MARTGLQMLRSPDGWSVYYKSVLVARLHHQLLTDNLNYLIYQLDGVWSRYLVEFMDNNTLARVKLVEMTVAALRSREIDIQHWEFRPDCSFSIDNTGVYLNHRKGPWYWSRKPLNEFQFEPVTEGVKGHRRGLEQLTRQLRHDYRNHLTLSGNLDTLHRRYGFSGRGFSAHNHSLYIYSLHIQQRAIIKLYDSTPKGSHLHGLVFVRFMRRCYVYAMVYCDCPANAIVNRIRRSIETAYGIAFSKRFLQISMTMVNGEVLGSGDVQMTDQYGNVIANARDGYYMQYSKLRDALEFPITALSTHYTHYPHARRIIAQHLSRLVTVERVVNNDLSLVSMETDEEITEWEGS